MHINLTKIKVDKQTTWSMTLSAKRKDKTGIKIFCIIWFDFFPAQLKFAFGIRYLPEYGRNLSVQCLFFKFNSLNSELLKKIKFETFWFENELGQ